MNTLTTTRRKPAQKRRLYKPLPLALLDDAERLLFFVIDVILLVTCAVTLTALLFPGVGAILLS